jgi:phage pi2 protein 07
MKTIKRENIPIKVIDEAIEVRYESMDELLRQATAGTTPLIIVGGFRDTTSMLYKVETPFIKVTSAEHPIYQKDLTAWNKGFVHEFKGPELAARLANPGECQICHYKDGDTDHYPENRAESWDIVFNGFAVLLPKEPGLSCSYPRHLVMGYDNCKRQLDLWGVKDVERKNDLWSEKYVKGLIEP